MANRALLSFAALGLAVAAAESLAQPLDASGRWQLAIEQRRPACRWVGTVTLVQDGERLTGTGRAAAVAVKGGGRCPLLEGRIRGAVTGAVIRFGFAAGAGGEARFEGEIEADGRVMTGAWSRLGAGGGWRADR